MIECGTLRDLRLRLILDSKHNFAFHVHVNIVKLSSCSY